MLQECENFQNFDVKFELLIMVCCDKFQLFFTIYICNNFVSFIKKNTKNSI